MKHLALILPLVFLFSSAQAANINKGNWEIGGGLDLSNNSSFTSFSLEANAQQFLADHISAGLSASYYTANSNSIYSVGPVASFYFPLSETTAPYVRITPIQLTGYSSYTSILSSNLRVGVKFFLTEAVAFGPAFDYAHQWPKDRWRSNDTFSLLFAFSIHL